jgi:hypothetical protein
VVSLDRHEERLTPVTAVASLGYGDPRRDGDPLSYLRGRDPGNDADDPLRHRLGLSELPRHASPETGPLLRVLLLRG